MKKILCIFLGIGLLFGLVAVYCVTFNPFEETHLTEEEMVAQIRKYNLGTYDQQEYEDAVLVLANEDNSLCILKEKEKDNFILADNPEKGNLYYEIVSMEKSNMKPIGASGYGIAFEDVKGEEWLYWTINTPNEIRVGYGDLPGDHRKAKIKELEQEKRGFIPISWED